MYVCFSTFRYLIIVFSFVEFYGKFSLLNQFRQIPQTKKVRKIAQANERSSTSTLLTINNLHISQWIFNELLEIIYNRLRLESIYFNYFEFIYAKTWRLFAKQINRYSKIDCIDNSKISHPAKTTQTYLNDILIDFITLILMTKFDNPDRNSS